LLRAAWRGQHSNRRRWRQSGLGFIVPAALLGEEQKRI
jgi:hypothetical protein